LALPRPSNDDPRPPDGLITGGGGASTDKLTDVYQRLGSIQSSVTYLEGFAHDARIELKGISTEITAARLRIGHCGGYLVSRERYF